MDTLQLHIFSDKVAIHWARLLYQMVDFWMLIASSYVRLLIGLSFIQQCGMEPLGYFSASQPHQIILLGRLYVRIYHYNSKYMFYDAIFTFKMEVWIFRVKINSGATWMSKMRFKNVTGFDKCLYTHNSNTPFTITRQL